MKELNELRESMKEGSRYIGFDKTVKGLIKDAKIFHPSQIDQIKQGWSTPNNEKYNTKVKEALSIYKELIKDY